LIIINMHGMYVKKNKGVPFCAKCRLLTVMDVMYVVYIFTTVF